MIQLSPVSRAGRLGPLALCGLFLLHALPFLTRPVLIGGDEPHFALIAHSLALDLDVDLSDDYREVAEGSPAAGERFRGKDLEPHTRRVGERELPAHPLGLPAAVAPLVRALEVGSPGSAPDVLLGLAGLLVTFGALLAGRRLAIEHLGDVRAGTALALCLHFSTPLWFGSRTFFTEPYLAALPVLALFAWTRRREVLAGALLGVAFLIKESALVLIVPLLVALVLAGDRRRSRRLALPAAVAVALFVTKNLWLAGQPLATYHPFELGDPLAGAVGLLFDLRHGLLPFAPLALLALFGWPRTVGRERTALVTAYIAFGGFFLLTASWAKWQGGSCFGPRLLIPALPALALPLAEAWRRFGGRSWFRGLAAASVASGCAVELAAAVDPFAAFWEASVPELLVARPLVAFGGGLLALFALLRWPPASRARAL